VAGLLAPIAPLANISTQNPVLRRFTAGMLGITSRRPFPKFTGRRARASRLPGKAGKCVIFLSDAYTRHIEPHIEQAAFDILNRLGYEVRVLPIPAAGAALMSKGFLEAARRHAALLLDRLNRIDPDRVLAVAGIEPPEVYALKHDYYDLLPARRDEIVQRVENVWLLEEFLLRDEDFSDLRVATKGIKILFQPHCHQRAVGPASDGIPNGTAATVELLRTCGYEVEMIEAGCCGMAGTFGYEVEHYELSNRIAELGLFPRIREGSGSVIVSTGAACRMQILHGTNMSVEHPIVLAGRAVLRK
jgi:Fe-S oxidoreductase